MTTTPDPRSAKPTKVAVYLGGTVPYVELQTPTSRVTLVGDDHVAFDMDAREGETRHVIDLSPPRPPSGRVVPEELFQRVRRLLVIGQQFHSPCSCDWCKLTPLFDACYPAPQPVTEGTLQSLGEVALLTDLELAHKVAWERGEYGAASKFRDFHGRVKASFASRTELSRCSPVSSAPRTPRKVYLSDYQLSTLRMVRDHYVGEHDSNGMSDGDLIDWAADQFLTDYMGEHGPKGNLRQPVSSALVAAGQAMRGAVGRLTGMHGEDGGSGIGCNCDLCTTKRRWDVAYEDATTTSGSDLVSTPSVRTEPTPAGQHSPLRECDKCGKVFEPAGLCRKCAAEVDAPPTPQGGLAEDVIPAGVAMRRVLERVWKHPLFGELSSDCMEAMAQWDAAGTPAFDTAPPNTGSKSPDTAAPYEGDTMNFTGESYEPAIEVKVPVSRCWKCPKCGQVFFDHVGVDAVECSCHTKMEIDEVKPERPATEDLCKGCSHPMSSHAPSGPDVVGGCYYPECDGFCHCMIEPTNSNDVIRSMCRIVASDRTTPDDRAMALETLREALHPSTPLDPEDLI